MAKELAPALSYDRDADVLYISLFSSEEPVCTEEFDDLLLVDRGMFTKQILGFRFLDVRAHGIEQILLQYGPHLLEFFREGQEAVQSQKSSFERLSREIQEKQFRDRLKELVGA